MLGQDVVSATTAAAHEPVGLTHAQLDICDAEAVREAVRAARADVVVNCAAWTDVDGAEAHPGEAEAANGDGAANVARAAFEAGAWTIHVSSDYVFDGDKGDPYIETDPTNPVSAYGRSKLAGERAIAEAAPAAHTIVRSSWLFGIAGPCFPATIMRLARERDELRVVDDQVGCPTFTGHLACALTELATTRPLAILHLAGGGECSWYEFAREIVARAGLAIEVAPTTSEEFPRPAPRPAYSVLRSESRNVPRLPHWRDGLAEYLAAGVPAT